MKSLPKSNLAARGAITTTRARKVPYGMICMITGLLLLSVAAVTDALVGPDLSANALRVLAFLGQLGFILVLAGFWFALIGLRRERL